MCQHNVPQVRGIKSLCNSVAAYHSSKDRTICSMASVPTFAMPVCNMQNHLIVLAAAKTLTSELLTQWFRQPLSDDSRQAAARAAATFEGVDWDGLGCSCHRAQCLFLRGALTLLAARPPPAAAAGPARRRAAELLEAAVKLQPSLLDAWTCLGGLHSSAGELVMALHCLSAGLSAGVSVEGLRQMSLVLRRLAASTGALPLERHEAVSASLAAAKQAVSMDVSDGFSWYVLGMAHVAASSALPAAAKSTSTPTDQTPSVTTMHCSSSSDSSSRQPADTAAALKQQQQQQCDAASNAARAALAAFTAAGRCGLDDLPELWFNRAAVALHLGELGQALQDFSTAAELDPSLPAAAQVAGITQLTATLASRLLQGGGGGRQAGLTPNQAAGLQASLAADLASGAVQQLLPSGWHLISWQQLQLHQEQQQHPLQRQQQPRAVAAAAHQAAGSSGKRISGSGGRWQSSSSGGVAIGSSSGSGSSGGSGQSHAALHCRIAAVLERLPGCAQWVCIAMAACGGCFPLMLPSPTVGISEVVGRCLLLLQPTTSHISLPAGWGGQASNKAVHLAVVRVKGAGSILSGDGGSCSSATTDSKGAGSIAGQECSSRQADVSLRTMLIMGNSTAVSTSAS